jgi:hypothetical protein
LGDAQYVPLDSRCSSGQTESNLNGIWKRVEVKLSRARKELDDKDIIRERDSMADKLLFESQVKKKLHFRALSDLKFGDDSL